MSYIKTIREALSQRLDKNPRYSLRAFAKAIRVNPATLSLILSGKSTPSYKIAERISRSLGLSPEEREIFLDSVVATKKKLGSKRLHPQFRARKGAVSANQTQSLDIEAFRLMSDWYHTAILELIATVDFVSDPKWIAQRLGISELEVKLAIERMESLELIERGKDGVIVRTKPYFMTEDRHLTSSAHRRRQKQILEKSLVSLEEIPIQQRNHSAMTMSIDPDLIPEAKKRIDRFLSELCQFLETGKREEVYELQVSLFPLSQSLHPAEKEEQSYEK